MQPLTLKSEAHAYTMDSWRSAHDLPEQADSIFPIGTSLKYLGHLPGGMIKVEFNGGEYVIHPATTVELS